jgi:hypothetical protein
MSTTIRPEISKKKIDWMERHRYYELKHFCLQYPIWKKAAAGLLNKINTTQLPRIAKSYGYIPDPVQKTAMAREAYLRRIRMIEDSAFEADEALHRYILLGVTLGLSYPKLSAQYDIPAGKDYYYKAYRRFFTILNKKQLCLWT